LLPQNCLWGGASKYTLKKNLDIPTAWLIENVIPNVGKRYADDKGFVCNLGLAMLWLVFDDEAREALKVPDAIMERVKLAYENLDQQNKPQQPVKKVSLHVYRIEDQTMIDEILQEEQQTDTLGGALERLPAPGGGNHAVQHILKTVVIMQQNLQRLMQNLESRMNNQDQANREYMDSKFRTINNNLRAYGGTIQGAMSRGIWRNTATAASQPIGRPWPSLAPNIKDLVALWQEYNHGLNERLATNE
jgi:hypothetical protein